MHHHHAGHQQASGGHSHGDDDWGDRAELLELDAEVLGGYLADVTDWVRELAGDLNCRRIVDLGAGPGGGTFALVKRFDGAELIAVDKSAELLGRVEVKAGQLGLADRVSAVQADLDAGWPGLDAADLVWASMSLHHLADPDRVLGEIFAAIRPGGYLAVAELEAFPRFLPHDIGLGRPGLEERCQAALSRETAESLPHLGSDWGPRLEQAGFSVVGERQFVIDLTPPLPAAAGRYAQATLRLIRAALADRADAEDLATLDTLIGSAGPDGVLQRDDLTIRARRVAWMARRP